MTARRMSAKMKIPNGLPIAIANGHVHCPLPMQFVMLTHSTIAINNHNWQWP